ncbi:trace amine-associated receptor 1-like [Parambassis ranga]|uniref:Trace amine-associated receptor 1-like n=1 Tax=Parambassis ranga TaxID=210632 RepID=A0A6P7HZ04_9TELE|nr:trace amine-associated receptor 1-like [Parambassis ranga]
MDLETNVNSSYVTNIHPCYELDNATYIFTTNPSIICTVLYIFLALLSVVTICGNLLVIISIIYFKQLHTPTNYLVLSLAVADLLIGVIVYPFSMAFTLTSCLYHENLFYRYYAVCQPLTYRTKINTQATVIMILVCWGVSALIGIGIITAGFSQGTCEDMCSVDVALANTMGPVFSFYFPAIVMLCIYLKIFLVAQKQVNSIQSTNCQRTKSGAALSKVERKATKTLAIVMGVFLLCLMPYFLCVVFQPLASNPPPVPLIEALNWLTLSNSMLNPLIYAFFYSWFRSASRMIISGKIFQGKMQQIAWFMLAMLWIVQCVLGCPDTCKCSRKSGPEKSEVNCHKKGLRAFPSQLPSDAWIIKLGENGITDLKANMLRSIPRIESINLERNAIKSIHPQAFSGAKQLMLLNLYGNHIVSLPPRGFQDLLNLRFLMLGRNQIGILKPEMFAGMRNLSDLDLPLNALTMLPSNAFKPLIALKVLDLSLNRIQRISPKAFTGLRQLLFLNLGNNRSQ